MLALRLYLKDRDSIKYEDLVMFSDGIQNRFLSFLRPDLMRSIEEERHEEELAQSMSLEEFKAELERIRRG